MLGIFPRGSPGPEGGAGPHGECRGRSPTERPEAGGRAPQSSRAGGAQMGLSQRSGGPRGLGEKSCPKGDFKKCVLGFGKREKPADCSGPRLFRHEGDTQNVQNVLEKRPAPVRARCRVITGLSQESWGRQLLLTVPPRDPQEPRGLRFAGWQGGW